MSTFYGTNGISPGCLYDLTLRGAHNDQLTCFSPSGQQGPVSWVRVAKDGSDGEAVIETVVTSPNNSGLYKRHEYRLRDGWQGVLVVTTYRNAGKDMRKGTVDGGGFKPNGDTLGFPLTTKVSVDEARALLDRHAAAKAAAAPVAAPTGEPKAKAKKK